jgi:hypothetical protein
MEETALGIRPSSNSGKKKQETEMCLNDTVITTHRLNLSYYATTTIQLDPPVPNHSVQDEKDSVGDCLRLVQGLQ